MEKFNMHDVEMADDGGPHCEPVTIWLTERQKAIYEWLRDVKKVKSAKEMKKVMGPHLEALASRFGFPDDNAA